MSSSYENKFIEEKLMKKKKVAEKLLAQITLRMTRIMKKEFDKLCKKRGIIPQVLIRILIEKELKRSDNEK